MSLPSITRSSGTFPPPREWWCDEVLNWYEQAIWLYDTLRSDHPDYFRRVVGDADAQPLLR